MEKQKNQNEQGLYVREAERDSCGVGLLADLNAIPSHEIVSSSLTLLEHMEHRGACGCEENTGDGAGILTQIPHDFFISQAEVLGDTIPRRGNYGVGMIFLPKDQHKKEFCLNRIQAMAKILEFKIFWIRQVPVDNSMIGNSALQSEPEIVQIFFKTDSFKHTALEKRFYFLRSSIMKEIYDYDPSLTDDFYISSLSSKTIVYKGLLKATQLRLYFLDLQSDSFKSAVAIVHSRFSTNTIPKWKLAQPFRCIAHNGEINTIQGNINWWKARENHMQKISDDNPTLKKVFPICDPYISDSGNFDNVVDFLLTAGRSIPHSMMMLIPEAWQNDVRMPEYKRAFYEYHDTVIEPWDGPASICFTDGTILGATLDRNGLRPSRYLLTDDNLLVIASEVGCLNINPKNIKLKGRLEPGKIMIADLDEHRIIEDWEVKETICKRKPYAKWLEKHSLNIEDLAKSKLENKISRPLLQRQIAFGMSKEDKDLIIRSMLSNSKEPIGSMGADIPLAVLSKLAQHPASYFKQAFAQVTNPPIDSLREKFYMSLSTAIGAGSKIIRIGKREAKTIRFKTPFLTVQERANLINSTLPHITSAVLDITYRKGQNLESALNAACNNAFELIQNSVNVIVLSDRLVQEQRINIPSLFITGALHHFLIEKGMRKDVSLVVEAGDIWETQHFATLLSYGADLICPYLAIETVISSAKELNIDEDRALLQYRKAVNVGLLKIMSKLGISTLASYKGAQTFEALGISDEVINTCFKGTVSRIGGMRFEDLEKENIAKHNLAFIKEKEYLPDLGFFQWKGHGEYHLFNPKTIHLLQHATRSKDYDIYKKFAEEIDRVENNVSTLRSFFRVKPQQAIPLHQVESREDILKRFASGAMSFGSISHEAHTTLARAMNRIGGKSNSGEGGEDEKRFIRREDGDLERSAIKQVASGRFGVTINYLTNAEEIQIKMAQGAKPGEGGQLPGHKVDKTIARVRNSTPGVGLISPPPHHDIYSIEDLAQLIFDLKNANRQARISVKLVSKAGVGVIASGVTKAHADHILISGSDGGTGASPLSSIKHSGLPWELGLAETHQTLIRNGLRDRVVLQTDGQIRTGRDLAVATMLGAEEWGIATAALVVEGCILMRKCHLNTCPVGIATQDVALRKKFAGKVDHLVNYFHFLADHLREIMASCGVRTVNELVGRTDLLEVELKDKHWKTQNLNLSTLLYKEPNPYNQTLYCSQKQNHALDSVLDRELIDKTKRARKTNGTFHAEYSIKSTDRAVGAMLSNEIAKEYGSNGMLEDAISIKFRGSAGQSFAAFISKGIYFNLEGEANDYLGKGLSGGKIAITPDRTAQFVSTDNVIIGNVALYGATSGEAYINGKAGDRFAVRNSGAKTVVEGVGHNACEYMTGGIAVILGDIGRNFAAGMSGGIAFIYNEDDILRNVNNEMVLLESPSNDDLKELQGLIENHYLHTKSVYAGDILSKWEKQKMKFIKVIPIEYKKALMQLLPNILKAI